MKRFMKLLCIAVCILISIGFTYFLCEKGLMKGGTENLTTKNITLEMTEIKNAVINNGTIIIKKDPQIILSSLNTMIKTVYLEGADWQEEVQVYFSNNTGVFLEENSVKLAPQKIDGGLLLQINREVSDLRIDLTGPENSKYYVNSIIVNPQTVLKWGVSMFLISAFLGAAIGFILYFLFSEFPYFKRYFGALKKYRYLLEDMVMRDIKLKYRRSVIGLLWSILNPLLMMIVITAVFQKMFKFTIDNFAVYYLTGWVIFNFITEATTGAMTSILNSSILIRKVYIPKYIFPLQKCIFAFVNMIFSLVALVLVMVVLGTRINWSILLIPVPLVLALFFSIGIGMFLSTATVFFRDMIHLYTVFTMVWMYLTPIIYPVDILSAKMLSIIKLNPMYYFVDYFRQLTLYGTIPGKTDLLILIFWSVFSMMIGISVFKKRQDKFILYI